MAYSPHGNIDDLAVTLAFAQLRSRMIQTLRRIGLNADRHPDRDGREKGTIRPKSSNGDANVPRLQPA
jgi:hypothetical protein